MGFSLHSITTALVQVLDEAEAQWAATVLIPLEFGNRSFRSFRTVEANDASTFRSSTWFVLDLSLFDFANRSEQFNEIIVTGRPRQLWRYMSAQCITSHKANAWELTLRT